MHTDTALYQYRADGLRDPDPAALPAGAPCGPLLPLERVGPAARGPQPRQAKGQGQQEDQGRADGHIGWFQEQGEPGA